jgi:hypothetical protein
MMISRKMRWSGHASCRGEKLYAYRFSVRKPEEKRLLGRSRSRWEYNIEMDLRGIE